MVEQRPCYAGHAGVSRIAPCFYPRADQVDKGKFHEPANIVVLVAALSRDKITGRPSPGFADKTLAVQIVLPMAGRLTESGIYDELVDSGHYSSPTLRTFRLSIPLSSMILTAIREFGCTVNHRDSFPAYFSMSS